MELLGNILYPACNAFWQTFVRGLSVIEHQVVLNPVYHAVLTHFHSVIYRGNSSVAVIDPIVFNLEAGSGGALTEQLFSTPAGGVAAGKVLFAVCAVVCLYAAVILTKRFINAIPPSPL